jgi:hypothetical protein
MDGSHDLIASERLRRNRLEGGAKAGSEERPVAVNMSANISEGAPMASEAETGAERLDGLQRSEELADGVRRIAILKVERYASKEVVSRDEEPSLRLEEAHVRGRMARSVVGDPLANVSGNGDAVKQRPMRLDDARDMDRASAKPLLVEADLLRRSASASGDRDAARNLPLPVSDHEGGVLVARMHPELAASAVDDAARLTVVVRVGVGADEEGRLLKGKTAHLKRALEVLDRPRLVDASVKEDEA